MKLEGRGPNHVRQPHAPAQCQAAAPGHSGGRGRSSRAARRRFVLQGANGSGKSTILETILTLWRFWGEWIEQGRGSTPPAEHLSHFLAKADLAAVEFMDVPESPGPLWIGMGKRSEWRALRE